jgi:hypothetical protein
MHTALSPQTGQPTNKHLLATTTTAEGIAPGGSTEATVAHELKELGQHALVCTVQYGQQEIAVNGEQRVVSRSFRKVRSSFRISIQEAHLDHLHRSTSSPSPLPSPSAPKPILRLRPAPLPPSPPRNAPSSSSKCKSTIITSPPSSLSE